jgi:hypothetical protein
VQFLQSMPLVLLDYGFHGVSSFFADIFKTTLNNGVLPEVSEAFLRLFCGRADNYWLT